MYGSYLQYWSMYGWVLSTVDSNVCMVLSTVDSNVCKNYWQVELKGPLTLVFYLRPHREHMKIPMYINKVLVPIHKILVKWFPTFSVHLATWTLENHSPVCDLWSHIHWKVIASIKQLWFQFKLSKFQIFSQSYNLPVGDLWPVHIWHFTH